MINFSKEDLLKLANFSSLYLDEREIDFYNKQLKMVLDYIDTLQQVPITEEAESVKNKNIFREDQSKATNAENVLNQAPQRKDRYFVVPNILD